MELFLIFVLSILFFILIVNDYKFNIFSSPKKLDFTFNVLVVLLITITMVKTIGGNFINKTLVSGLSIVLMIASFAFLYVNRKKTLINPYIITLILYLALNIIVCNPHQIFMSWQRLFLFIIVLTIASPLFINRVAYLFRRYCIIWGQLLCIIISAVSFVCYFIDINLMTYEGKYLEDYEYIGGHFSGITNQSMMLGPIAGISVLSLLCDFFSFKKTKKWSLLIICTGTLLFSASRAAIVATLIGVICALLIQRRNKKHFMRKTIVPLVVLLMLFPLWDSALNGIRQKNASRADSGRFESRTDKFEGRLHEFASSPIFGIGYGVIRLSRLHTLSNVSIEPGSSWLGILSMTGIIGFVIFFLFYFKCWTIVRRNELDIQQKAFLMALLSFFAVNMIFEGYIYAGGSPLCLLVWLVLGVSYDCKYKYLYDSKDVKK